MTSCANPNPHNMTPPCNPAELCAPITMPPECCPPKLPLAADVCPVVVRPLDDCFNSNRSIYTASNDVNGNNLCQCVCLPPNVTLTAAQAAAVSAMLDGILASISPYNRCPDTCEILPETGHFIPLNGDCCDSYPHSPFLHSGLRRDIGYGRPMPFTDMDAGGTSYQYHEKLGKLFCCAKTAISGAVPTPVGP